MITVKFLCETSIQESKCNTTFMEFFEENFMSLLEKFAIKGLPLQMTKAEKGVIEIYIK